MFSDLTQGERRIFRILSTPIKIQNFLERIPINFEVSGETCRSPRRVIRDRLAHCMEGALFAAAALWFHGERPLLLDLRATKKDDDHVVALFRRGGYWGAISKTNHAVLRYREPVYRSVRELAMGYFHEYFVDSGRKTLRDFSRPFDLRGFADRAWMTAEEDLWYLCKALDDSPHQDVMPPGFARRMRQADRIEIEAGKITQWPHPSKAYHAHAL